MGAPEGPEDIARLLRGLPRRQPPDTPIDAIFERWQVRRRNSVALLGIGLAAGLLAFVLVRPAPADRPPVHLELRIVDTTRFQPVDEPPAPASGSDQMPPEISGP